MADNADVETTNHKIDHNVRKCVVVGTKTLEDDFFGFLIGDDAENSCEIINCIECTNFVTSPRHSGINRKPYWFKEINQICSILPTGLKICGLCYISENNEILKQSSIEEIFSQVDPQNELINNNLLLWLLDREACDVDKDKAFIYNIQRKWIRETVIYHCDIAGRFLSEHVTFRMKCKFAVSAEEIKDTDMCMTLSKKVTQICDKLPSASFHIPECRMLIGDGIIHDTKKTCGDLLEDIIDDEEGFSQGRFDKKRRSKANKKDVLNVQLVESLNKNNKSNNHDHVPVIYCQKRESNYINIMLVVDLLVMIASNASICRLPSLFIRGIKDQLQAIMYCIKTYAKESTLYVPKVYHFKTRQTSHLITCIYPWREINGGIIDDSEFVKQRSDLLKKLLLPSQRPTIHPNNNYLFQDDRPEACYIVNPHEGLTNPGGAGCHVAVVDGCYSYHHYMQDNFDDNKWGCAYRSLQTICSWFRHQGYTEKSVPDHRSIQEALAAVGDKDSSFIGSKKWIGSFEVSLCLEYFLGVTSKIMAINSGAELQYKGRELIQHFETQGTPVMIGGGVLAHTILGVSFNDRTGEIKFLILDPHYTGGEDLKIILDKGWCGWKSQLFWNQQAHYNLCMPQRPIKV